MTDKIYPMPLDKNDEASKALTILRRFRKTLGPLPDEWQIWIIESLAAGHIESLSAG